MQLTYEQALLDRNISYETIITYYNKPKFVYKYQSFYNDDGSLNAHWKSNITGKTFRLNKASAFEDKNDCRPYFRQDYILKRIEDFYRYFAPTSVERALDLAREEINQATFERIREHYQNEIFIGCLTVSNNNEEMWDKYSNNKTGYCIEYEVADNFLLSDSMLPVLYSDKPYDSSDLFFLNLVLTAVQRGKNIALEENLKVYGEYFRWLLKLSYVPVFIKERAKWSYEKEYRLFLLKHRNTTKKMIRAEDYLDENQCIDLSDSVRSIYLGKRFDENPESDTLLNEIHEVIKTSGKNIGVHRL